jgi:putative endonuclease
MGAAGERVAAQWLAHQGLQILARNAAVDDGEVDLLAVDGTRRVVIEVRTITGPGDPIDAVSTIKRRRVRRLGAMAGASRVDYIGVGIRDWGVEIHWLPG